MFGDVKEIVVPEPSWRDRLDGLIGTRRDAVIVVAFAAGAVAIALVLWARGRPAEIAPPAESPISSVEAPSPDGTLPGVMASPAADVVLVHVAGAVRRPGLYEIPSGGRIADAIDAAGGPRRQADLGAVNLAELLVDGQKLDVPRAGEAPSVVASPTATAGSPALVSINTADQAALETIPDVGPVTAMAIISYREEAGGFASIDELLEVDGIGPATLETIRPHVTL